MYRESFLAGLGNLLVHQGHATDVETIRGALLHHMIEDTETTHDELATEFGESIRDIVLEASAYCMQHYFEPFHTLSCLSSSRCADEPLIAPELPKP